jgi:hypothetical protein
VQIDGHADETSFEHLIDCQNHSSKISGPTLGQRYGEHNPPGDAARRERSPSIEANPADAANGGQPPRVLFLAASCNIQKINTNFAFFGAAIAEIAGCLAFWAGSGWGSQLG